MRAVVIEDEIPAAKRLIKMLESIDDEMEIVSKMDSVESAVRYFNQSPAIDIVFMDIQLADGISFDIFQQAEVNCPVIFTTAFDQYTLKAFKVNSVDYLLKPIDEAELRNAVRKYKNFYQQRTEGLSEQIRSMGQQIVTVGYKERLLIKRGQQLSYLKIESTSYCYADGKLCYAVDFNNNKFLLENNISQLEEQLDPKKFFRINRHLLVNIESINKVHTWLGGRLKLELKLDSLADTVVSRERVNDFKAWLGQ
jgi:DNA-binding LytR/AlgR family response regulator